MKKFFSSKFFLAFILLLQLLCTILLGCCVGNIVNQDKNSVASADSVYPAIPDDYILSPLDLELVNYNLPRITLPEGLYYFSSSLDGFSSFSIQSFGTSTSAFFYSYEMNRLFKSITSSGYTYVVNSTDRYYSSEGGFIYVLPDSTFYLNASLSDLFPSHSNGAVYNSSVADYVLSHTLFSVTEVRAIPLTETLFNTFSSIIAWISSSFLGLVSIFYTAEIGLTVWGILAIVGLSISLFILLLYLVANFLRFRG